MTDLPGYPSCRSFLKASAASVMLSGLAVSAQAEQQTPPVPLEEYERQYFNDVEWTFILAAVARLIPSEGDGPGAIEARVPVFIDGQLAGDYGRADDWYMVGPHDAAADPLRGWQTPLNPAQIFRQGIPAFNAWCEQKYSAAFAALTPAQQDEALTALQKGDVGLQPELRDFFGVLLSNTKEGYFADPMYGGNHGMQAWTYIGFPGARGSYKEWVERHNIPYPLGPVSIKGEKGLNMARQEKKKDVVIVGLGWTGSILAMELAQEGLDIVALERGHDQNTVPDFKYPNMIDELKYGVRLKMMQRASQQTVTVRRNADEVALPYRSLGSFLPGNGVGGAGTHWNGLNWRPQAEELKLRSHVRERWGEQIIPEDMLLGDYPVSYDEMEPFFDRFERVAGISGKAGNLKGEKIEGGNPFEGWRSNEYPMPPMPTTWDGRKFADAAKAMGYHPFPSPGGIASTAYVNEYGMQMGPCNHCGFCERFGCYQYSKSSPQTAILDALKRMPNFSYRTESEVLRVEMAADGKTATGVTYFDEKTQEQVFQPADIVILASFSLNNVHLALLSGIGQAYDPATGEGVTGRNYAYQMNGGVTLFFKDEAFNPFIGTGANGMCIDDFGINQIDFGREGFIGGAYWRSGQTNGQPIRSMPLPQGTPGWGGGWKKAIAEWYGHAMSIGTHGSVMAYKTNHLDLDPTYKDRHGRPLMRMTFNWNPNDIRMTQFMKGKLEELAKTMNPDLMQSSFKKEGSQYDVRPYQTTHNTGGHSMSDNPREGVVNRYSQAWDKHNVFMTGAGNFVQNTQYNPTGLLGGLAYYTAHAIRTQYLSNPRPLV